MNKIGFAVLIAYVQKLIDRGISNNSYALSFGDAQDIEGLIKEGMPTGPVKASELDYLLSCMGTEGKKIEAIKTYRAMTGEGLKESKDAVERHWVQRVTVKPYHSVEN